MPWESGAIKTLAANHVVPAGKRARVTGLAENEPRNDAPKNGAIAVTTLAQGLRRSKILAGYIVKLVGCWTVVGFCGRRRQTAP